LTYLPTEQLPPSPDDRVTVYDVYCTDESGQRFIVEMQRNWQLHFKERTLYYNTFPITHQVEKGGRWEYDLLPIYCLGILNFRMDDDPRYLRRVQLADVDTGETFYDKLTFVFIELPKFDRSLAQLETAAERWVYLLKRLPELQDIPAELAQEPFTRTFAIAEQAALSPQERWMYEASLKRARDDRATLESAVWKGREETRQAIARSMLAEGLDVAFVVRITGLPEEEMAALFEEVRHVA